VLVYERVDAADRLLVALNLGAGTTSVALEDGGRGAVVAGTRVGRAGAHVVDCADLGGLEGVVVRLEGRS
jgi:hypothetical protein